MGSFCFGFFVFVGVMLIYEWFFRIIIEVSENAFIILIKKKKKKSELESN